MRLVCIFTDTKEMLEHRKKFTQDHLDYLQKHSQEIRIGGGLREEEGGDFVGGLWIMDVVSFERAQELIKNDPYYAPKYRSYTLKVWGKAFDTPVTL